MKTKRYKITAIIRYDFGELRYAAKAAQKSALEHLTLHCNALKNHDDVDSVIICSPCDGRNQSFIDGVARKILPGVEFFLGDIKDAGKRLLAACRHYGLDLFLDYVMTASPVSAFDLSGMHRLWQEAAADIVFFAGTPKTLSPKLISVPFFKQVYDHWPGWPYYGYITLHEHLFNVRYYTPRDAIPPTQGLHTFNGVHAKFARVFTPTPDGIVLETGTGFNPFVALLFIIYGARKVVPVHQP